MKRVINSKVKRESVNSSDLNSRKYYGVDINGFRGFISRERFEEGDYRLLCPDSLTEGNGWVMMERDTLEKTVDAVIADGQSVYQFDTFNELMEWVCKGLS